MIYEVEDQIAEYYKKIQFTEEFCGKLREQMLTDIVEQKKQSAKERDDFRRERDRLQNRQKKLMEAYYDSLINKELLQKEQSDLSKQLVDIEAKLTVAEEEYEATERHLMEALELIGNCHKAYKQAPDSVRRTFNQVFFEKIYVSPNREGDTKVVIKADLQEPFQSLTKNQRDFCAVGFSQRHLVGVT